MKLSAIFFTTLAAVAVADSPPPADPVLILPAFLRDAPPGVIKNILFSESNERFYLVKDLQGLPHLVVARISSEPDYGDAKKREVQPNQKRSAMPAPIAAAEAWRWKWQPGVGEPNWKRDADSGVNSGSNSEANSGA